MGQELEAEQDWRLQAVTTLAQAFADRETGHAFEAGSLVTLTAPVHFDRNSLLILPVPNGTALFLSMSRRSYEEASKLLASCQRDANHEDLLLFKDDNRAIDFLENMAGAVISACAALEAFANEFIPSGFRYEIARKDGKCTEIYAKEQIERYVSLDDKLGRVLPTALGVESPKGEQAWSGYVRIRRLRDRLLHLKAQDRAPTPARPDSVWNALATCPPPHLAAKGVLDYFVKHLPVAPRWASHYPCDFSGPTPD